MFLADHHHSPLVLALLAVSHEIGADTLVPFFQREVETLMQHQTALQMAEAFGLQLSSTSTSLTDLGSSASLSSCDLSDMGSDLVDTFVVIDAPPPLRHATMTEGGCCSACCQRFGLLVRPHHCRLCKDIFCDPCTAHYLYLGDELEQDALDELGVTMLGSMVRHTRQMLMPDGHGSRHCHRCFQIRLDPMFQHVHTVLRLLQLTDEDLASAAQIWPFQAGDVLRQRDKQRSRAFASEPPV